VRPIPVHREIDEDGEEVIDLAKQHERRVIKPVNPANDLPPAEPRLSKDDHAQPKRRKPAAAPDQPAPMPTPKVNSKPEPKIPKSDPSEEHPPPRVPAGKRTPVPKANPQEPQDTHDALNALADDGRSPMPTTLDPDIAVNPPVEFEDDDNADDAHADVAAAVNKPTSVRQARQAREARQAKLQGLQANTMGFQFRQIAIPLLLVTAVLLGAVGGATLYLGMEYNPAEDGTNVLLENGKLFGGISCILALSLLLGAVVFHWEVRRAKKREQNNPTPKPQR
jgi:hypothetical protein